MKKTVLIASAAFLLFAASVSAQTTPEPSKQPVTAQAPSKDKYNNWTADTYKMQPMPEALTTEKIFPVIGKYQVTDKEGNASTLSVTLDETNKGFAWIDGLPQGRVKANLMKSPAVYKIPAQKIGEGKDAKDVAEGVLIYDKDANQFNACIGCTYNNADPANAFSTAEPVTEEVAATDVKTSKTKAAKTAKPKVAKVKPVYYSGTKITEAAAPAQQ